MAISTLSSNASFSPFWELSVFGEVRKEGLQLNLCRDKRPKFECHNWKILTLGQPTESKACCRSNTAPHPRLIVEQSEIKKSGVA